MRTPYSAMELKVAEINRLSGTPIERFIGEAKEAKEQLGNYYLKYGTEGLMLVRVTGGGGQFGVIYKSTFGKEEMLDKFLDVLIRSRATISRKMGGQYE